MARLVDTIRKFAYPLREDRCYTTIGRHPEADIFLPPEKYSALVSRFHATIIASMGELYLIDHSFNGTFYPVDRAGPIEHTTRVMSAYSTHVFAEQKKEMKQRWTSHLLADVEQYGEAVPRMPGYVEHGFKDIDNIEYLLRMIENTEQRELLLPAGRKMSPETILAITPAHRFLFLF